MDAIADKILVNSVLIILAAQGFIHPIIPVIVILRDSIVNSIKMIESSGSPSIDASIKKVITDTLTYMKPPSQNLKSKVVDITLVIDLS